MNAITTIPWHAPAPAHAPSATPTVRRDGAATVLIVAVAAFALGLVVGALGIEGGAAAGHNTKAPVPHPRQLFR